MITQAISRLENKLLKVRTRKQVRDAYAEYVDFREKFLNYLSSTKDYTVAVLKLSEEQQQCIDSLIDENKVNGFDGDGFRVREPNLHFYFDEKTKIESDGKKAKIYTSWLPEGFPVMVSNQFLEAKPKTNEPIGATEFLFTRTKVTSSAKLNPKIKKHFPKQKLEVTQGSRITSSYKLVTPEGLEERASHYFYLGSFEFTNGEVHVYGCNFEDKRKAKIQEYPNFNSS